MALFASGFIIGAGLAVLAYAAWLRRVRVPVGRLFPDEGAPIGVPPAPRDQVLARHAANGGTGTVYQSFAVWRGEVYADYRGRALRAGLVPVTQAEWTDLLYKTFGRR